MQNQLKKIISNSNTRDYIPNKEEFRKYYKIVNKDIFHSKLEEKPLVYFRPLPNHRAWYKAGVYLFDTYFETKKLFLEVLVHEMVHGWQDMNDHKVAHGPTFYKWRPVLQEFDLRLLRVL